MRSSVGLDETILNQRSLAGDLAAFNQWMDVHQVTAFNLAYWLLANEKRAAVIVQTSLEMAFRQLESFKEERILSWWLRIVVTACRAQIPVTTEGQAQQEPSSPTERMKWAMAQLPQEQRLTLLLSEHCNLSRAEIASVLGEQQDLVTGTIHTARALLRHHMFGSSSPHSLSPM
jgi:DNA-directed RNA polymerase specialized sigma24 family protein